MISGEQFKTDHSNVKLIVIDDGSLIHGLNICSNDDIMCWYDTYLSHAITNKNKEMYNIYDVILPDNANVTMESGGVNVDRFITSNKRTVTDEINIRKIAQDYNNFKFMKKYEKTYKVCRRLAQKNGMFLRHIPGEHKDYKMCLLAVRNKGNALAFVPKKYRNKELCALAVDNPLKPKKTWYGARNYNCKAYKHVPKELRNYELTKCAIKNSGRMIIHVPKNILSYELLELAVLDNILVLSDIQKHNLVKEDELIKLYSAAMRKYLNSSNLHFFRNPTRLVPNDIVKKATNI
jgi:hypothetical protein